VATVRQRGRIDDLAIGTMLAVLGMSVLPFPAWMFAPAAWAAALAGALRMRGWATRHTAGEPLLWVLHAGYAWTSVALFCLGVAAVAPTLLSTSTAMHAVTVGALGTYTMGMMSRVTLGHTGRPRTASTLTGAAFAAIIGAGLVRVLGPVATPAAPVWALHTSGALWTLAFALFLVVHAPMLSLARPDGKKG
jgi:uncharacterized protein involved in response to NO